MNKTILIVEDEFIVAEDLQLTLRNADYTVCGIADNVAEARAIIENKKPSLVLLDIHIKGKLNGIDLAKALKQHIAFDLMAVKVKVQGLNIYSAISFLRIGFDEYQTIGVNELSVIAGLKEDDVKAIMMNSPVEYTPGVLNDKDFEKSLS